MRRPDLVTSAAAGFVIFDGVVAQLLGAPVIAAILAVFSVFVFALFHSAARHPAGDMEAIVEATCEPRDPDITEWEKELQR